MLYHLTQLTSAFTPRTSSISTRIKRHEDASRITSDVLCPESLDEAAKNCTELQLNSLAIESIASPPKIRRLLQEISVGTVARPLSKSDTWRVSYVSGSSFNDNKRASVCASLQEPIVLPVLRCTMTTNGRMPVFNREISTRGFKTDRNIKAEIKRNPSIFGRLRQWAGFSKSGYEVTLKQIS